MTFTPTQIANWRRFELVRPQGLFNMFDPQARRATGLNPTEYTYVMQHYAALKEAANALPSL